MVGDFYNEPGESNFPVGVIQGNYFDGRFPQ